MFRMILLAGLASVAASASASETFNLVERIDHEEIIPQSKGKDSLGDQVVFHNSLFDSNNKSLMGTDNGVCVRTIVGETFQCSITFSLASGYLVDVGTFKDKGDSVLAITGGTRKYAGAGGSMKIHSRDDQSYDFIFDLNSVGLR